MELFSFSLTVQDEYTLHQFTFPSVTKELQKELKEDGCILAHHSRFQSMGILLKLEHKVREHEAKQKGPLPDGQGAVRMQTPEKPSLFRAQLTPTPPCTTSNQASHPTFYFPLMPSINESINGISHL